VQVLTVPNWSLAREQGVVRQACEYLAASGVRVHYCQGDLDHNRTVTAFSGPAAEVGEALAGLSRQILPSIDLRRHVGVHPRIGGLDVCPFVPLGSFEPEAFRAWVEERAAAFAEEFGVPVLLYERSERGRHESALPALRQGGFGRLAEKNLDPDFGPRSAHERLGMTAWGWRDFLLAVNVELRQPLPDLAKRIAKRIRDLRADGDMRMLGVRALGFPLPSRGLSQVSMNLTLPDITSADPVLEFVSQEAAKEGVGTEGYELVGVIRERDLPGASRLPYQPSQVVEGAA
jgi:glutamate formiminotransferase